MSHASIDRQTLRKGSKRIIGPFKLAANAVIVRGVMVAVNAGGFLVRASDTAALRVVGRSEEAADNTGGSNGDIEILASEGIFKLATGGGSAVDQADIGRRVYTLDNQTVVKAAGTTNTIPAGILHELDADGSPWVQIDANTLLEVGGS